MSLGVIKAGSERLLRLWSSHSRTVGHPASGDWGEVCVEDWDANELALQNGTRLLSTYTSTAGIKFWIITEWDRSITTILLPEDY